MKASDRCFGAGIRRPPASGRGIRLDRAREVARSRAQLLLRCPRLHPALCTGALLIRYRLPPPSGGACLQAVARLPQPGERSAGGVGLPSERRAQRRDVDAALGGDQGDQHGVLRRLGTGAVGGGDGGGLMVGRCRDRRAAGRGDDQALTFPCLRGGVGPLRPLRPALDRRPTYRAGTLTTGSSTTATPSCPFIWGSLGSSISISFRTKRCPRKPGAAQAHDDRRIGRLVGATLDQYCSRSICGRGCGRLRARCRRPWCSLVVVAGGSEGVDEEGAGGALAPGAAAVEGGQASSPWRISRVRRSQWPGTCAKFACSAGSIASRSAW